MEIRDRARALLSENDAKWLAVMASIEDAVMAACDARLAAFCRQAIPEAYEAYEAIEQPAWDAYVAIEQPALAAYRAIEQPAWEAYVAIEQPAYAAYVAIRQPARRDIILPAIMGWASHAH